jgi:hypothetical protein
MKRLPLAAPLTLARHAQSVELHSAPAAALRAAVLRGAWEEAADALAAVALPPPRAALWLLRRAALSGGEAALKAMSLTSARVTCALRLRRAARDGRAASAVLPAPVANIKERARKSEAV